MNDFNTIYNYAIKKAESLGSKYVELLKFERKEIEKQGAEQYWVELIKSKKKFSTNKHMLVLPFLLKITPIDPTFTYQLMIEHKDGISQDAIKITSNGESIVVSPNTLINTKRGFIEACELKETDEII